MTLHRRLLCGLLAASLAGCGASFDSRTLLTKLRVLALQAAPVNPAQGETTTLKVNAEAYADTTIQGARGDANRFRQILEQYNNAPFSSRWNIYADSMNAIIGNAKQVFYNQPGQTFYYTVDRPQFDAGQAPGR